MERKHAKRISKRGREKGGRRTTQRQGNTGGVASRGKSWNSTATAQQKMGTKVLCEVPAREWHSLAHTPTRHRSHKHSHTHSPWQHVCICRRSPRDAAVIYNNWSRPLVATLAGRQVASVCRVAVAAPGRRKAEGRQGRRGRQLICPECHERSFTRD